MKPQKVRLRTFGTPGRGAHYFMVSTKHSDLFGESVEMVRYDRHMPASDDGGKTIPVWEVWQAPPAPPPASEAYADGWRAWWKDMGRAMARGDRGSIPRRPAGRNGAGSSPASPTSRGVDQRAESPPTTNEKEPRT